MYTMQVQKGAKSNHPIYSHLTQKARHLIIMLYIFRALGCADTGVAYGSNVGTAFADFTGTLGHVEWTLCKLSSLTDTGYIQFK